MSYQWFHWLVVLNVFCWCRCDSVTQYLGRWVCNHTYGTPFTTMSEVGSHLACTAACEMEAICSSALYYPRTGDCIKNMNTSLQIGDTSTCITVKYVAILKRPCATNMDCSVPSNSECAGGECQCINGYSLTPSEGTCTPGCTNYGDTFRDFPNEGLNGFNTDFIDNLSFSQCKQACALETRFVCRTVDYSTASSRCHLSTETAYTQPMSYDTSAASTGWMFAHRNCA